MEILELGPDDRLDVMLGGSCDKRWRQLIALPMLEPVPWVHFFNFEREHWDVSLIDSEETAKQRAKFVLWVITEDSRSTSSLMEVSRFLYGLQPHQEFVVVMGLNIPSSAKIDGASLGARELRDVNRQRAYARDMIVRRQREEPRISAFWVGEPGSKDPSHYPATGTAVAAAIHYILNKTAGGL